MVPCPSADPDRPQYHLQAKSGWINDPNGPLYFDGLYHLFYQHVPGKPEWDFGIVWGHWVSEDMVHWRHLPWALQPHDNTMDQDGCFSGCALVHEGKPHIFYTGVALKAKAPRHVEDHGYNPSLPFIENTLCATAVDPGSDRELVRWEKRHAPLISGPPRDMALVGWRDPFIVQEGDPNRGLDWVMLIGSGVPGVGGTVLQYRSDHPLHGWVYDGMLCVGALEHGAMWECPLLFPLQAHPLSVRGKYGAAAKRMQQQATCRIVVNMSGVGGSMASLPSRAMLGRPSIESDAGRATSASFGKPSLSITNIAGLSRDGAATPLPSPAGSVRETRGTFGAGFSIHPSSSKHSLAELAERRVSLASARVTEPRHTTGEMLERRGRGYSVTATASKRSLRDAGGTLPDTASTRGCAGEQVMGGPLRAAPAAPETSDSLLHAPPTLPGNAGPHEPAGSTVVRPDRHHMRETASKEDIHPKSVDRERGFSGFSYTSQSNLVAAAAEVERRRPSMERSRRSMELSRRNLLDAPMAHTPKSEGAHDTFVRPAKPTTSVPGGTGDQASSAMATVLEDDALGHSSQQPVSGASVRHKSSKDVSLLAEVPAVRQPRAPSDVVEMHFLCVSPDAPTNPVVYYLGDYSDGRFKLEDALGPLRLDLGDVLYAPNTFKDANGRQILVGWLQERREGAGIGYAGCLTAMRVITVRDGRVFQEPIPEVRKLRQGHGWYRALASIRDDLPVQIELAEQRAVDIDVTIERGSAAAAGLRIAPYDSAHGPASVLYDWQRGTIEVVVEAPGAGGDVARSVGGLVSGGSNEEDTQLKMRILLDGSCLEVFLGSGEVLSTRVYRGGASMHDMATMEPTLSFVAIGGTAQLVRAEVWEMGSIWARSGVSKGSTAAGTAPELRVVRDFDDSGSMPVQPAI